MKSQKIKQISITKNTTILEALKKMDDLAVRLLLVMEEDNFASLVSIGDIQRAIINNISLNTSVHEILRKNIKVAYQQDSFESIKARMLEFRIECMPVVDDDFNLINVFFWEDIFEKERKGNKIKLNLPVVIMAGGKGSRLKPITNVLPKALIPVGEKTVSEQIMDRFIDAGCNNFYFSVNYKAEMIQYYFNTLENSNYNISYFTEDKYLGTAGSLFLLKGKIKTTFFVSNCDIIIEEDYGEIYKYHKENNNEITIVAALKHYKIPYGTIKTKEGGILTSLSEKPELTFKINSGMYILEPHALEEIPGNEFFHITELIDKISKKNGKVGVFPISEKSWKDIGEWDKYLKTILP